MSRRLPLVALVAGTALALSNAPARAGFPVSEQVTCAVGGEEFTFTTTGSYSTFGARPDGKPYGSWVFPLPMPDCPGNGLVMYRDFSPEEITVLESYIASAAFAAIRQESSYYRAARIAGQLEAADDLSPLWLLMRAGWQVDGDNAAKARYQREFAEGVAALSGDASSANRVTLTFRAANAWRELGEFDRAGEVLSGIADPAAATFESDTSERQQQNWREWLARDIPRLGELIAQKNAESEPVAMIPDTQAAFRCIELEQSGASLPQRCTSGELDEDMSRVRHSRVPADES